MDVSALFVGLGILSGSPQPASLIQVTTADQAYFDGLEARSEALEAERGRWVLETGHSVVYARGKLQVYTPDGQGVAPIDISELLAEYPEGEVWVATVPEQERAVEVFVGEKDDQQGFLLVAELPGRKAANDQNIWYGTQLVVSEGNSSPYEFSALNFQTGKTVDPFKRPRSSGFGLGFNHVRGYADVGLDLILVDPYSATGPIGNGSVPVFGGGLRFEGGIGGVIEYGVFGARAQVDTRSFTIGAGLKILQVEYVNFAGSGGMQVTFRFFRYNRKLPWEFEIGGGSFFDSSLEWHGVVMGSQAIWSKPIGSHTLVVSLYGKGRAWELRYDDGGYGTEVELVIGCKLTFGRSI